MSEDCVCGHGADRHQQHPYQCDKCGCDKFRGRTQEYARGLTHAEAEALRSHGFDPDDIIIAEAQIRQGKVMNMRDFFLSLEGGS